MKIKHTYSLAIFLTAFITARCFAITGKDNWTYLRKSNEVMIQQPTFAGIFGPDGLFNACATDDELKSIKPVESCLEYQKGTYKDNSCAAYETRSVSISRTYIQNVCTKRNLIGTCTQYTSKKSLYPTSFQLAVIEVSEDDYGNFLFTKTIAIQSCD